MAYRILVIEDNPENLELIRYLVAAFGHEPLLARNGLEGLQIAASESPDLILCDIQLPDLDGMEVARRLRADPRLAGIPRVAVTALAMVGDRERILAGGFDGYLAKPIAPESFLADISRYLSQQRFGPTAAEEAPQPPLMSLRLPEPPLNPVPAAAPERRSASAKGSILVVDDSSSNRNLTRTILEAAGYHVREAASLREAQAALTYHFDLIVSDVHMPGGNGLDLLEATQRDSRTRSIPFAFLTSSLLFEQDRAGAIARGAAAFIPRPVESKELVRQLESCMKAGPKRVDEFKGDCNADDSCGR